MDSKRNKHKNNTYRNSKAKVKHGQDHEPEVFVLPPNILQKLGIQFEKVESGQENPTTDFSVPDISNEKTNSQKKIVPKELQEPLDGEAAKDVSLMETAALMKDSVLLSPTFAPVISNTGELELLALNTTTVPQPVIFGDSESLIDDVLVQKSDKVHGTGIIKNIDQDNLLITPIFNGHPNVIVSDVSPVEKMFSTNIKVESVEVPDTEVPQELEGVSTDDHLDEAYLSDCSTSNLEPVENIEPLNQTPRNGKKVTIISEEILTPHKCMTRNFEISNLSHACPVSRGTIISGSTSEIHLNAKQDNFVKCVKLVSSPVRCYQRKVRIDKRSTEEVEIQNVSLSDCIDISVSDIEEHLKENEEILQEFANEIISNDTGDIINKIESSEKLSEMNNVKIVTDFKDRENIFCNLQYGNDQLFEKLKCLYNNFNNNNTHNHEMPHKTLAVESNNMFTSLKHNKISDFLNCEENHIVSKLDVENNAENSIDISVKLNMDKNEDIFMEKMNDQKSTNNLEDKVEEISKYLKECLNRVKNKSLAKANKSKESYLRKLVHKDLKSNQGVEKPGGNQKHQQRTSLPKPLKTYRKATRRDVPKAIFSLNKINTDEHKLKELSTLLPNEQNTIPVSENTLHENFCLCGDFGRKAFYDSDTPYKHIHFWEQRVFNIETDLVYSIFSDDCNTLNSDNCVLNPEDFQENNTIELDLAVYNICWNTLEHGKCDTSKCKNTMANLQQETSASQNMTLVFDTVCNKRETINSTNEMCYKKQEELENYENTMTEITTDVSCVADVCEKTKESAVEQPETYVDHEFCLAQCIANDASIQNRESDNDEIIVVQVQDSLEVTHAQKARRLGSGNDDINYDQEPFDLIKDNPRETKKKKTKKSSEPTANTRRFTFEDEIESDSEQSPISKNKNAKKRRKSSLQVGSDEEPLSIKKVRKQKSLDKESVVSLESSNVFKSNKDVLIAKSETEGNSVHCGVCSQAVNTSDWFQHIGKEHSYVAWKLGEPAVDMNDEEKFESHLKEILKQTAGLVCSKCGLTRKYVKPYLKHINQCDADVKIKLEIDNSNSHVNVDISSDTVNKSKDLVKCGVCNIEVHPQKWMNHIRRAHDYLAWKHGETLDLDNPDAVNEHLASIVQKEGQLICSKCGLQRKYVKKYLDHIKVCTSERTVAEETDDATNEAIIEGDIVCAVCKEKLDPKKWNVHNMKNHYNLAWIQGEPPVVATSIYIIERLLKEYKEKYNELICKVCGISRVSCMGFYAHILVCGKSEEEIEKFKILCDICNKQYLFLYQSQHMTAHREQKNAKERKKQAEIRKTMTEQDTPETPYGRRRAAEKARTVIEKYNDNTSSATYKCDKCSFSSDIKKEFNKHNCVTGVADSDEEPPGDSESEDSYDDVDSNMSEEEEKISVKKGKKDIVQSPMAKSKVLPFIAPKPKEYIVKSGEEYYKTYFSSEELFPEWRNMACEDVPEQDIPSYMPPLQESCKVRVSNANGEGEWKVYKRFQADKNKGTTSLFVGASIQCAKWVAPRAKDEVGSRDEDSFLAVSVHRGADAPRFPANETPSHSAHIQIWDFGKFKSIPKFVFGLAHDYGTVWSMDWCPSGARDAPDSESPRLGLLATACSDGIVHIFSVPYRLSTSDKLFHKIKPVAELRNSSSSERKLYQATAVKWCKQIGHALIFVGYSDGTTAYYDLNTDSPLLRTTENGVTVFYPYFDERSHNSCVADVSTFPLGARAGATISCASTGVRVTSSPALRPRRRATHHAAVKAEFDPLFPHAIFTTDSSRLLSSPPELDWVGAGRPLGSLSALAGCARCGLCLAYAAPHFRTMRPHPAYLETKKQMFGTLDMISIGNKRKKPLKTDNLTTIVEPTTYEEAIKKYGVELKIDKNLKAPNNSRQRDIFPERFPLSTPSSMVFCPAPAHHDRVAIATHSGVIFVTSVLL